MYIDVSVWLWLVSVTAVSATVFYQQLFVFVGFILYVITPSVWEKSTKVEINVETGENISYKHLTVISDAVRYLSCTCVGLYDEPCVWGCEFGNLMQSSGIFPKISDSYNDI